MREGGLGCGRSDESPSNLPTTQAIPELAPQGAKTC